jgi:hypothetical protein
MHNSIISTSGMDQDSHLARDNSFEGNEGWVDMNSYNQNNMSEYGGFGYMHPPPVTHGMSTEPVRLPLPPPQAISSQPQQQQQQQQSHPQTSLPMLIMPNHPTWPSMLTNPASYSAPPVTMRSTPTLPTLPTLPAKPQRVPSQTTSTPRRTLTDEDRRRMCQYHEDNPGMKQSDIGALFGVERR